MKLEFKKNDKGEPFVKIAGKDFSTTDYLKMIKEISAGKNIEATYENFTQEETDSVDLMIKEINKIGTSPEAENDSLGVEDYGDEINPDDIPF